MKNISITIYGCERDEEKAFRSLSPKFGVMPTIISDAVSEDNAKSGNQCISVGHKSELSEPIILALRNAGVRYISTRSIGCNHIDTTAAKKMGISIGNVAYSPDSVADYTVMLMLMAIRNAKSIVRSVENYDFRLDSVRGKELRDMTIGVIGTGRIGKAVIKRLQGFGCHVLAYDSKLDTSADYVSLDGLLRNSDIVTLHVPLNEDTRHIISYEQMQKMKRSAYIINTGRGALIDTDALIKMLENRNLGGAALDVLEGEEGIFYFDCTQKRIDNQFILKLQKMPNVIITPHTAYYTERALHDTVEKTINNCLNFERSMAHG